MLDIRWIRSNPNELDNALSKRGHEKISSRVLEKDHNHKNTLNELQCCQEKRNAYAKEFQNYKKEGRDTSDLLKESESNKAKIAELELTLKSQEDELLDILSHIPNTPSDECPVGKDESDNVLIRTVGTPKNYDFEVKAHFDVLKNLMDFETASKMSGSRFVVLYGHLAKLERALANWMLDVHTTEFGYTEVYPPLLVKDSAMFGVGQLPKFKEDMFQTTNDYWLISTAETVLTNLVANKTLNDLPLRFTAYTPCFRSEAGAAGKDTRGMIRQHQFGKVELVSVVEPNNSKDEHERMTSCAESILKRLDLPYRVMLLSTGDMGFCSTKTYDIEVWLPTQKTYREISSCSNCGDFQARRMNAKFKSDSKNMFVHTLNGSGLAVGRTLVAILENYQDQSGKIQIPEVLRPYMKMDYIDLC